ncbi:MAG: ABC transporter ATP-binding protein [Deltaproteobacteria bacterium]|nr:ABC transporter ATP-binding protein [Deltaproteobacteria bacterium]
MSATGTVDAPLLKLDAVSVAFGGIRALDGVSLEVRAGEMVTLIGANGAGKTTTLRTITGLVRPVSGSVWHAGDRLDTVRADRIVARGIAMVPEGRAIFGNLTVKENLRLGAYLVRDVAQIRRALDHNFALFPRLKEREQQVAGTLSGGEQQMLAIARALMSSPRLLLLDEPSLGIAPILVQAIFEAVLRIRREGTTVLLVEQNAHLALDTSDRAYVLETGRVLLDGICSVVKSDPRVKEAYLGEGVEVAGGAP